MWGVGNIHWCGMVMLTGVGCSLEWGGNYHEFHCDGITLGTLFFTDQLIFDLFIICLSETKFAQYFRCVSCLLGSTNWVNMLTNFRAGTRHISRDGITLR